MNNQSPLVPQGSLLEQKNQGRARVKIAVFFVLAIHGIGLVALLMQGCQKEKEPSGPAVPTNAAVLPTPEPTNVVADTTPAVTSSNPVTTTATPVAEPPKTETTAGASEYKVAKGDNFTTIAHHFKITVKALAEANPGVDSARLKVDQVLKIPAPVAAPAPGTTTSATTATDTADGEMYTVESGDNLTTIAKKKNTSVRALRAANNLKTDQLKVGQKLKIPKSAPATGTPAPK